MSLSENIYRKTSLFDTKKALYIKIYLKSLITKPKLNIINNLN